MVAVITSHLLPEQLDHQGSLRSANGYFTSTPTKCEVQTDVFPLCSQVVS